MKLSIILISYDMAREIPRTLQSLARTYQHEMADLDYEVLLVDNGSPEPLDPVRCRVGVPHSIHPLDQAGTPPVPQDAALRPDSRRLCWVVRSK